MDKKILKQELVKIITGYDDCNDCEVCQFRGCCSEEAIAEDLLEADWTKKEQGQWATRYWNTEDDWGIWNHHSVSCSACGAEFYNGSRTPYCPNCGAEMTNSAATTLCPNRG